MENKEEKLKADLEQNYFRYELVKDKSKLEIIDVLRTIEKSCDKLRREDLCGDVAFINVYKSDGELYHQIKIGGSGDDYIEYYRSDVFKMADSMSNIYEGLNYRIEVTFEI
jgi:hypothetical protein